VFELTHVCCRYLRSGGSSLGYNSDIVINTTPPTVVSVGPKKNVQGAGTVGVGEVINLSVTFDQNVTVYHHNGPTLSTQPYLLLETGSTNRKAYYTSTEGTLVHFVYTVQPGDSAPDLDYVSTAALTIPTGSYIRRSATTPTTDVNPALPSPGESNSLADKAAILVDTTTPKVFRVDASPTDATNAAIRNSASTLTGATKLASGDAVYINVKFNQVSGLVGSLTNRHAFETP